MDKELEKEVLTRLLHSHPTGLGKELLDNYRGERSVAECLNQLKERGLIHNHAKGQSEELVYPIKLSSSGVEAAKAFE